MRCEKLVDGCAGNGAGIDTAAGRYHSLSLSQAMARTFNRITQLLDGQIRFLGLIALLCVLVMLVLIHFYS